MLLTIIAYNKTVVNTINIAVSGLDAASKRLFAAASNVANVSTVGSLEEGDQAPYTPIRASSASQSNVSGAPSGVLTRFEAVDQPFVPSFDPDSPFANEEGIIGAPNVNLDEELVNAKAAEIAYKSNARMIEAVQENFDALIDIFDDD